jgi:carbon monoxide dehydrogenase subunit G
VIELHHQFTVDLDVEAAWQVLTDLPTVAQCLPGAQLDEERDGEFRGGLAARIGPISARYRGVATFLEKDDVAHRAVVEARGQEEKGSGTASARIELVLHPAPSGTVVDVSTEMNISGRAAQFGRSLLADVSESMMTQFADNLGRRVASGTATTDQKPATDAGLASGSSPRGAVFDEVAGAELDVLALLGPMVRRAAVPLAASVAGLALGLLAGRGRRRTGAPWPHLTLILPAASASECA